MKSLRMALAVADTGSFRRAARLLEMAPSSLSHAITELELTLKLRLFHRTTRSVALTVEGEAFLSRIRPVLGELRVAVDEINQRQEGNISGELRINTPFAAALYLLKEVVPSFMKLHPDIELELRHEERPVDIVADGCDAGIRLGGSVPIDMIGVPFGGKARFVPVASADYLQQYGRPAHPAELMAHKCIRIRMPRGERYAWEFERKGERIELDVPGSLTVNRMALMIEAAEGDLGVAFVLEQAVAQSLADGKLQLLLNDWCQDEPGLMLYYPGRRNVPAPLRAFISFIQALGR
ncbi:LysR family transcriptional regulator [Pseudomonas sp. Irchel 3A5]|uniref:LysR family transcriptional regulator n=1 Tax=Pseudomonas sp. Irchel 3A5 TaxID=2008911 RepID=UPI00211435AB|nr:LysR family transcriptional regulator [Pseudomonas sp. Irchel 3A5]